MMDWLEWLSRLPFLVALFIVWFATSVVAILFAWAVFGG